MECGVRCLHDGNARRKLPHVGERASSCACQMTYSAGTGGLPTVGTRDIVYDQ